MRNKGQRSSNSRGFGGLVIALVVACLALAPVLGSAQVPTDPDHRGSALDDILPERKADGSRKRIRRRDFRRLLDRELSIIETIESLEFQILKKDEHLKSVEAEEKMVTEELQGLDKLLEEEELALQAHRERMRKRLRSMKRLMRTETLHLVFASESFSDYLLRERLLHKLLEQDRERFLAYLDAQRRHRELKTERKARSDGLKAIKKDVLQSTARLRTDRADIDDLLRRVETERSYYEKHHDELQRRSRWVARKIRDLDEWDEPSWFNGRKGQLPLPMRHADVAKRYGYHVSPFGTKVLEQGVTFRPGRVREDQTRVSVYSVYPGKVVFADKLSGYGKTVIVDHAKGYYTLYAKLAQITVKEGEVLRGRERLGFLARRHNLHKAELYFELRIKGRPVNPKAWFR